MPPPVAHTFSALPINCCCCDCLPQDSCAPLDEPSRLGRRPEDPRTSVGDRPLPERGRLEASATSIGGIGPGRDQKRHVIVALWFGNRKADWHHIEKSRFGQCHPVTREIIAYGKP